MTTIEQVPVERLYDVPPKVLRDLAKGFQKAFAGYGSIPALFVSIPIAEGRAPINEASMSNGIYVVERTERESEKFLEMVVTRTPLPEDDTFKSETAILTDGKDEHGRRVIIVKYVKIKRISQVEQDAIAQDAAEKGEEGMSGQLADLAGVSEVRLDGLVAVPAVRDFIEGIRMANPNISRKFARRGKI